MKLVIFKDLPQHLLDEMLNYGPFLSDNEYLVMIESDYMELVDEELRLEMDRYHHN